MFDRVKVSGKVEGAFFEAQAENKARINRTITTQPSGTLPVAQE